MRGHSRRWSLRLAKPRGFKAGALCWACGPSHLMLTPEKIKLCVFIWECSPPKVVSIPTTARDTPILINRGLLIRGQHLVASGTMSSTGCFMMRHARNQLTLTCCPQRWTSLFSDQHPKPGKRRNGQKKGCFSNGSKSPTPSIWSGGGGEFNAWRSA